MNKITKIIMYVLFLLILVLLFLLGNKNKKIMEKESEIVEDEIPDVEVDYINYDENFIEVDARTPEENAILKIKTREYISEITLNNKMIFELDNRTTAKNEPNNITRINYKMYDNNLCVINIQNNSEEKVMIGTIGINLEEIKKIVFENESEVRVCDDHGFTFSEGFIYYVDETGYYIKIDTEIYKKIEEIIYNLKFEINKTIRIIKEQS